MEGCAEQRESQAKGGVSMSHLRTTYYLLSVVIILLFAFGTSASFSTTADRTVSADVVGPEAGLLAVSQTTSDYNSTTDTANLEVTITNQATTAINEVKVEVDGETKSTDSLEPGESDSVTFTDVICTATITTRFTEGSLSVNINTAIKCS